MSLPRKYKVKILKDVMDLIEGVNKVPEELHYRDTYKNVEKYYDNLKYLKRMKRIPNKQFLELTSLSKIVTHKRWLDNLNESLGMRNLLAKRKKKSTR